MSQVHGKQIKDTSLRLAKIDPATGQTLTLVGTSKIQQPQAPVVGDDLTNKTYVDSVAAGLDPKEAVDLASTVNITGTYSNGASGVGASITGTGTLLLDGVTISVADRLLLKDQTNAEENGIYDVGTAGTNWALVRSLDFDGTPTNEINGGEFTFVMSGDTYADTGWVVSQPSGVDATVGTTQIEWVQFSSAGVITAGAGLEQSGNAINFQAGDNSLTVNATNSVVNTDGTTIQTGTSGIEVIDGGITSTQINSSVAGAGLTGGNGSSLAVNADNGLSINSDVVELGGELNKQTQIWGGNQNFYIGYGPTNSIADVISRFQVQTDQILRFDINDASGNDLTQVNMDTSSDGFIVEVENETTNTRNILLKQQNSGTFDINQIDLRGNGQPVTINSADHYMVVRDDFGQKGLVYNTDYSANFTEESLITKRYVDTQIGLVPTGDITGVTAGNGLSGGGTSGYVTLDVNTTNGLSIVSDSVALGGTLVQDTTVTQGIYDFLMTGGGTLGLDTQTFKMSPANDEEIIISNLTNSGTEARLEISSSSVGLASTDNGSTFSSLTVNHTAVNSIFLNASNSVNGNIAINIDSSKSDSFITDFSGSPKGLQYAGDYSGTFATNSLITRKYVDDAIATVPTGDITGVTAGDGLSGGGASGYVTLDVNTTNGLSIISDSVGLGGTLTQTTGINGGTFDLAFFNVSTYSVNSANLALTTTNSMSLSSGAGADFTLSFGGAGEVTDGSGDGFGLVYTSDYSGTFVTNSLVSKKYVDDAVASTPTGDVTGLTAGAGLVGGGNTGYLQLDVELTSNGGLTFSSAGDAGTLEVDESNLNYTTIASNLDGNGLVQNGTALDVNVGDGLAIVSDTVEASLVVNSGLTFSAGAIDLSLGTGLSISGGDVITDASLSLTTNGLTNSNVSSGSSIQTALEALDTQVGTIETSEIITQDFSPAPADNFTTGINAVSSATVSNTSDGDAFVFLNGVQQVVGGATSSAWFFSGDGGTTARTNLDPIAGDQLYVNIDTLGFDISGSNTDDDIITVKYDGLS